MNVVVVALWVKGSQVVAQEVYPVGLFDEGVELVDLGGRESSLGSAHEDVRVE